MPPPSSFRARRARQMKSFEPTTTLPTGQASPFERQNVTASAGPASSRGSSSSATTAFQNRAPSMCRGTPPSWATGGELADVRRRDGLVVGVGAGVLEDDEAGDRIVDVGRVAERLADLLQVERAVGLLVDRAHGRCRRRPHGSRPRAARCGRGSPAMTSWPRWSCAIWATRLPIAPEATKRPGLLAEQLGGALLERVDGRVVAEDVVADLGLGHGAAHLGRGLGDGVGAQVDDRHMAREDSAEQSAILRLRRSDPWCSGPTCQPVTLEIAGSNPVGSATFTRFHPTPRSPARTGRHLVRVAVRPGLPGTFVARTRVVRARILSR